MSGYLLTLVDTRNGKTVSVPFFDEEWNDAEEAKYTQGPFSLNDGRGYLFRIGEGIPQDDAAVGAGENEDEGKGRYRVESVRVKGGHVVYSEPA